MADCSIHIEIGTYAKQHANVAKEGGDEHAFNDNQPQNGIWCGTDSLADAKLAGALLHGYEHDVRHSDNA